MSGKGRVKLTPLPAFARVLGGDRVVLTPLPAFARVSGRGRVMLTPLPAFARVSGIVRVCGCREGCCVSPTSCSACLLVAHPENKATSC